ncbi:MAG: Na/Pi cotransporter family protein [Candidatus Omnitrophica bacterium]|nr:Na/Pi cotransporter family protein [Candidatus Omnitrophota bacterium]
MLYNTVAMKEIIFGIIGGLGLFLFGMKLLSEAFQKLAGTKLRQILKFLTDKAIIGVLTGAVVTGIIQSSSATTVMVVGFVNAGLLALKQAIGVIMGANIGTTVTAQIIAFKIDQYALPAIGLGFAIFILARRKTWKFWGQALLGFGLLFLGLFIMKQVLGPLKENPFTRQALIGLSTNPLLGILAGAIITAIIQSSSATTGLIMVMAFNGLVSFPACLSFILGANIGTTITAQLASIGTNLTARRTAFAHTLFNVIGASYMLIFIYNGWFVRFIEFITPGDVSNNILRHIANAHLVFNVLNTLVFLPFIGFLEKACLWLVPGELEELPAEPKFLEKHLLDTPPLALDQATKELVRMTEVAQDAVSYAMEGFFNRDLRLLARVSRREEAVDNLQKEITHYLVEVSQRSLLPRESEKLPALLHSVNDVERIGDHAENLQELSERAVEEKLPFSKHAIEELHLVYNEVNAMVEDVKRALQNDSHEHAQAALAREQTLNRLQIELRQNHIQRLSEGKCFVLSGIIFLDFINNLEKIGDHLTNIAQAVMGSFQWDDIKKYKGHVEAKD